MAETEFNIQNYIYEKQFHCPVCDHDFKASMVRFGKSRMASADSDLKQNFSPVDPLLYEIVLCPKCGYAESNSTFEKVLPEKTVEAIKGGLTASFAKREYPLEFTPAIAIERFEAAIVSLKAKKGKIGNEAFLNLKMAWISRDAKDRDGELLYLKTALEKFKEAFQTEKLPIVGMEEAAISYLMGELERRTGNEDEALRWFGKVLTNKNAETRIKDRALDMKELIREQREGTASPQKPQEEKKKFKLF